MLGARKWIVSLACMLLAAVVLVLGVPDRGMAQVLYGFDPGGPQRQHGRIIAGRQHRYHEQGHRPDA